MSTPGEANPRVLLFGDDTRSFLASVRSLGRRGLEVHAAPYSMRAPALASRYIARVHRIPYYLGDGQAWVDAVAEVIQTQRIGFVLACEERSILPLMRHRERFAGAVLAIPQEPAFSAFFDKLETHRLAEATGMPAPPAMAVSRRTTVAEVEAVLHSYPVVCKLRRSYDWPDIYARSKVFIARTPAELAQWLAKGPESDDAALVEGHIGGFGLGISVLSQEGCVVQAFEHHRVSEMEGSSYYRVSRPVHAERLAAVQRMAEAVRFTGLAMFEFKHDTASGRWGLLEVNARPWGSLPLPVALGIDFPYGLHQLLSTGTAPPAKPYDTGICARNVLADFQQLRMRAHAGPGRLGTVRAVRATLAWGLQAMQVLTRREHWDTLTRDDPRPAWAEFSQLARATVARVVGGIAPALRRTPPPPAALHAPAGGPPLRVLFLCLGNICRSPYAERRARAMARDAGVTLAICSAGTLPRNPRPSTPEAVAAAARRGIALDDHRSQHADAALVAGQDLIVVFDRHVEQAFLDRYPELAHKVVHIAALGGGRAAVEIADPYGLDAGTFDRTYAEIDRLLAAWPLLQARVAR